MANLYSVLLPHLQEKLGVFALGLWIKLGLAAGPACEVSANNYAAGKVNLIVKVYHAWATERAKNHEPAHFPNKPNCPLQDLAIVGNLENHVAIRPLVERLTASYACSD